MNHKDNKINRILSFACIIFTILMLLSIVLRVFTRQILVERYGLNNSFAAFVFWDTASLVSEKTQPSHEEQTWSDLYPFPVLPEDLDMAVGGISDGDEIGFVSVENKARNRLLSPYTNRVDSVKGKLEAYATEFLMGHNLAAEAAVSLDHKLLWEKPVNPEDYTRIIKMENGYLTYVQPRVEDSDILAIADSIEDFGKFLSDIGIPLIYVNTGSKVSPSDMQLSDYEKQFEHTNENGDRLVNEIRRRGIYALDFRQCMIDSGRDWYSSYYVTDHHWTNETQLWAAGVLGDAISELTDFTIDRSLFDPENYAIEEYDNYMFGGEGRALTLKGASLEGYKLILPNFETNFRMTVLDGNRVFEGPYESSLFDMDAFNKIAGYSSTDYLSQKDPYNCIKIDNYPLSTIENLNEDNNSELNILLIEDSFNWYMASYLALDVGRMDIIYPIAFDGSIRNYVEYCNPDIVILSSCEKAINPIDYATHTSYFDLR